MVDETKIVSDGIQADESQSLLPTQMFCPCDDLSNKALPPVCGSRCNAMEIDRWVYIPFTPYDGVLEGYGPDAGYISIN